MQYLERLKDNSVGWQLGYRKNEIFDKKLFWKHCNPLRIGAQYFIEIWNFSTDKSIFETSQFVFPKVTFRSDFSNIK